MSNRAIIERELTQGVVPIGTPKAYQYDQALVESAVATVVQGLTKIGEYTEEKKSEYLNYANTILTAIQNQYGYPFVASTVSAMTDTTKIYVYTGSEEGYTAGDWYYYDGNAWVSGGEFNSTESGVKAEMSLFGVDDLLWEESIAASKTQNGITFTVDAVNKSVAISGTSTGTAVLNIFSYSTSPTPIPSWLQKGKTYIAHCHTNADVALEIRYIADGMSSSTLIASTNSYTEFTVPADATGVLIRLFISSGKTVNTVVRPFISETLSLGELENCMRFVGNAPLDFNDAEKPGYYYISSSAAGYYTHNPLPAYTGGLLEVIPTSTGSIITQKVRANTASNLSYTRRKLSGTWSDFVPEYDYSSDLDKKLDKTEASLFGVEDLLWKNGTKDGTSVSRAGVDYVVDKDARTVNMTGTANDISYYRFFGGAGSGMPTGFSVGKTYTAHMDTDTDARFQVYSYDENDVLTVLVDTRSQEEFTVPYDSARLVFRIYVANGGATNGTVRPFISKALQNRKKIKILALGNSGSEDMLTYAPLIIKNVAPELDLTLGVTYVSGASINKQIELFDNADGQQNIIRFDLFKAGTNAWTTKNNQTMKDCLLAEDWDVITIGQSSSYQTDYSTYANIPELIDKVATYVGTDHGNYKGHTVKFGYLAPQLRIANNDMVIVETPQSYPDYMSAVQQALNAYPLEFAIMGATAVMNARGTTLAQYGDAVVYTDASKTTVALTGQMSADYFHMQEGIGCMVCSYCSVLSILELAGINNRSVMGEQTRPDDAWLTEHNIIGQNYGSGIVGISDANCLIAQKCAIMAHKKPFEVSTIY